MRKYKTKKEKEIPCQAETIDKEVFATLKKKDSKCSGTVSSNIQWGNVFVFWAGLSCFYLLLFMLFGSSGVNIVDALIVTSIYALMVVVALVKYTASKEAFVVTLLFTIGYIFLAGKL